MHMSTCCYGVQFFPIVPPPTINKMPFSKNCLGSLLARQILMDTTRGLVKTRRFAWYVAIALRLDPFEILVHAHWWKTVWCVNMHTIDVTVYLSLDFPLAILIVHVPISWMDLGRATSAAVHNYSDNHAHIFLHCGHVSLCCWSYAQSRKEFS